MGAVVKKATSPSSKIGSRRTNNHRQRGGSNTTTTSSRGDENNHHRSNTPTSNSNCMKRQGHNNDNHIQGEKPQSTNTSSKSSTAPPTKKQNRGSPKKIKKCTSSISSKETTNDQKKPAAEGVLGSIFSYHEKGQRLKDDARTQTILYILVFVLAGLVMILTTAIFMLLLQNDTSTALVQLKMVAFQLSELPFLSSLFMSSPSSSLKNRHVVVAETLKDKETKDEETVQSTSSSYSTAGAMSITTDNANGMGVQVVKSPSPSLLDGSNSSTIDWEKVSSHPYFLNKENGTASALKNSEIAKDLEAKKSSIVAQCQLFLAPSTIPQAGLGLFTAVDIEKGQDVIVSDSSTNRIYDGDVTIHLVDPDLNVWPSVGLKLLMDDYAWDGHEVGGHFEGQSRIVSLMPGVGALANGLKRGYNTVMKPLNISHYATLIHSTSTNAATASTRGSYSTHDGTNRFVASTKVKAGSELFVAYGDKWFEERSRKKRQAKLQMELSTDDETETISKELKNAAQKETTSINPQKKRSLKELTQHGYCLDHIYASKSTIPNANKGAFASRYLPKGTVIAPMPLLPIVAKEALDMIRYRTSPQQQQQQQKSSSSKEQQQQNYEFRKQLLLNYCFGHKDSPVLLFSYGHMVNYINHAPISSEVNAYVRWSTKNERSEYLKTLSIEDYARQSATGLMMELVALRDIQPNEEIFIDYGHEWQQAWKTHEQEQRQKQLLLNNDNQQQQPHRPNSLVVQSAGYLNRQLLQAMQQQQRGATKTSSGSSNPIIDYFLTMPEQQKYPYPRNVHTACYFHYERAVNTKSIQFIGKSRDGRHQLLESSWKTEEQDHHKATNYLRPCLILERKTKSLADETNGGKSQLNEYTYLVEILNRPNTPNFEKIPSDTSRLFVQNIPHKFIQFVDKPYTTDQQSLDAFRHTMGLVGVPGETDQQEMLWPSQWLNRSTSSIDFEYIVQSFL